MRMTGAAPTGELTTSTQQSSDATLRAVTSAEAAVLLEGDFTLLRRLVQSGCATSVADDIRCTLLALIKPSGEGDKPLRSLTSFYESSFPDDVTACS